MIATLLHKRKLTAINPPKKIIIDCHLFFFISKEKLKLLKKLCLYYKMIFLQINKTMDLKIKIHP